MILNGDEDEWKRGIRDSGYFLIFGTDTYFRTVLTFEQSLYAMELKKKFIVALRHDVKIPTAFPIPDDAIIFKWADKDELMKKVKENLMRLMINELENI